MKKKLIIVLIVTIILAIILLVIFNFQKIKGFIYFYCIPHDMEIRVEGGIPIPTGYATDRYYYNINTKKKILYIIEDYYVFFPSDNYFERGSHYSIEKKELTEEEVNKLKDYAYGKTGEPEYENLDDRSDQIMETVTISYDGQTRTYGNGKFWRNFLDN